MQNSWQREAKDFETQERKIITDQVEKVKILIDYKLKEIEKYKSSEKIELQIKTEIENIKNEYENNKQQCINYLLDKILDVELNIPDVVLGLFSAKFNL